MSLRQGKAKSELGCPCPLDFSSTARKQRELEKPYAMHSNDLQRKVKRVGVRQVRISFYCTASFSICSLRRPIADPSTPTFGSTTKLQHILPYCSRRVTVAFVYAPSQV